MTYSPIQLEAIRIFGRKDLSFWCNVKLWENVKIIESQVNGSINEAYTLVNMHYSSFERQCFEILWHIPHLEDVTWRWKMIDIFFVLDTEIEELSWKIVDGNFNLIKRWDCRYESGKSLIEQSEETLTQLISLFK